MELAVQTLSAAGKGTQTVRKHSPTTTEAVIIFVQGVLLEVSGYQIFIS